jgi:hypothetical protein
MKGLGFRSTPYPQGPKVSLQDRRHADVVSGDVQQRRRRDTGRRLGEARPRPRPAATSSSSSPTAVRSRLSSGSPKKNRLVTASTT